MNDIVIIVELISKSNLKQSTTTTQFSIGDRDSGVAPKVTTDILLDRHKENLFKTVLHVMIGRNVTVW